MIPSAKTWILLVGTISVSLLVWLVLPDLVIAFNDDFGYLRSVVATWQHGRPWTDDWLEPWAASLSLVSGLIYKTTGSFMLATQGLQAVMAGVSFWAMTVLFGRRGLSAWAAVGVAVLVLFFPTLMVKWTEFTALVIYVPCLLWALDLVERRRWVLFFLVWAVAVTSRQSALAWLALPGMAVLQVWTSGTKETNGRGWFLPMVVCLAGLAVYGIMSQAMNVTHAQHVMTTAMWHSLSVGEMTEKFALAVGAFLVSAGCGAVANRVFGQKTGQAFLAPQGWRGAVRVVIAIGVIGWFWLDPRTSVAFDHPFYSETTGRCLLGMVFCLGAAGWAAGGFRLQTGPVVCAAGCALLVSLRGAVYDYYLIDVVLLGLLSVGPAGNSGERDEKAIWRPGQLRWAGVAVVIVLAGLELFFVGKQQRILDRYAAVVRLCEPGLRDGRIAPTELGVGPFGYTGWHLYPYFVTHEGAKGAYIGDFEKYLLRGSLSVGFTRCSEAAQEQERLVREALAQGNVLNSGVFKIGLRGPFLFVLSRTGPGAEAKLRVEPSHYRLQPYPLNDAEWRQVIAGEPVAEATQQR